MNDPNKKFSVFLTALLLLTGCGGGISINSNEFDPIKIHNKPKLKGESAEQPGETVSTPVIKITIKDRLHNSLQGLQLYTDDSPYIGDLVDEHSDTESSSYYLATEDADHTPGSGGPEDPDSYDHPNYAVNDNWTETEGLIGVTDENGEIDFECEGTERMIYVVKDGKFKDYCPMPCDGVEHSHVLNSPHGNLLLSVHRYNAEVIAQEINATDGKITGFDVFPVGSYPGKIIPHPRGNAFYVLDRYENSIFSVYASPLTDKLEQYAAPVPTGNWPFDGVMDQTGKCLFVSNILDGSVQSYQADAHGKLTPVLPTVQAPEGDQFSALAVSQNGLNFYAATTGTNRLFHYGVEPNTCLLTLSEITDIPFSVYNMKPDYHQGKLYFSSFNSNEIVWQALDSNGFFIADQQEQLTPVLPAGGAWPPADFYSQIVIDRHSSDTLAPMVTYNSIDVSSFALTADGAFAYALNNYWMQVQMFATDTNCNLIPLGFSEKMVAGTSGLTILNEKPGSHINHCNPAFYAPGWVERSTEMEWTYYF